MLENLTRRLEGIFKNLRGQGKLTPDNIRTGLREIRRALLEADVHVSVAKEFLTRVEARAIGREVLEGVDPGAMLVRVVYEELVTILGSTQTPIAQSPKSPTVILLVGLQGSGKTTFAAKLALWLKEKERRSLLASADVHRPAALEQLRVLAEANGLAFRPTNPTDTPETIARGALSEAIDRGMDYLVFDTAGRLTIDEEMMAEAKKLRTALKPHQIVLVLDGMTGQDAVRTGEAFSREIGIDGLVLTKMDGDARGGAALSLRHVTGKPILFLSVGEKVDAIEPFHPDRLASRILGMGDVLSLVEKAQEKIDLEKALELENKLRKSDLTLDDFLAQMREMRKLGSLGDILKMLPGGHRIDDRMSGEGERELKRVEAIILSMTPAERRKPSLLNASRKRRVAAGSGTQVQNVNKLLRDFEQVRILAKRMKGPGKRVPFAPPGMRGMGGFRFGG
ncbi:MAG: signal recognition particle protein [Candidatus Eiseniibacteriota bacterium]